MFCFKGIPRNRPVVLNKKHLIKYNQPNCKRCIHFNNNETCKLFKFVFSNEEKHITAELCRNDTDLCGPNAIFFDEKLDSFDLTIYK